MRLWKILISLFITTGTQLPSAPPVIRVVPKQITIETFSLHELAIIERISSWLKIHPHWRIKKFICFAYFNGLDYRKLNQGFLCLYGKSFRVYRRYIRVQEVKKLVLCEMSLPMITQLLNYSSIQLLKKDFQLIEGVSVEIFSENLLESK